MSIQQDYSPDLRSDEVFRFLKGGAPALDYIPPPRAGYQATKKQVAVGSAEKIDKLLLQLIWSKREWYNVIESTSLTPGQVVGQFSAFIPITQPIRITIIAFLQTKVGLPPNLVSAIETAFDSWPPAKDPQHFVQDTIAANPALKRDMFNVALGHTITKVGAAQPHYEQRDAALAPYTGKHSGLITPTPGGRSGSFAEYTNARRLTYTLVRTEELPDLPPAQKDPIHEVDAKKPIDEILTEIIKAESPRECEGGGTNAESGKSHL